MARKYPPKIPKIFTDYLGVMGLMIEGYKRSHNYNKPFTATSYEHMYNATKDELLNFMEFATESGSGGVYMDLKNTTRMASDDEIEWINENIREIVETMDELLETTPPSRVLPKQW